jgi:hypothetical protein
MKFVAFFILILIAVISCKEDFDTPPTSRLKATLYKYSNKEKDTLIVSITAVGHDSLFYDNEELTSFSLPLSTDNSTQYVIAFDSTNVVRDTINFVHENVLKYVSMESGFYYEYKLKKVTSTNHLITSIQIADSLVTKTLYENIKLYISTVSSSSD